ncbi:MAG TPA: hypothetical protein VKZ58_10745 [Longimicrobiales bacterium]|nr:hypothetical protein [Longimicrobiales bacterium]
MESRDPRTLRRTARAAIAAVLLPSLVLALQACESESTAVPEPCPTAGKWALGGGKGDRLDSACAWTGVIRLTHTESTDAKNEFADPFGTRHRILGQHRQDREIEIRITPGKATATLSGTWTGTWDVTTVQSCDDGRPGETVQKVYEDYEMRLSGAGEVEVTLTMEPDGAYRLDFTGPKEIWDKAGTTSVHFNDTCQDPPVILDHEETGSDREETSHRFAFTVRGRTAPGADRISGSDDLPLPIIESFGQGGHTGTIARIHSATWTLERRN